MGALNDKGVRFVYERTRPLAVDSMDDRKAIHHVVEKVSAA